MIALNQVEWKVEPKGDPKQIGQDLMNDDHAQ